MLIKKYKVYSIQEFLNKDLIENVNYLDKSIANIKRNKRKYMALILLIALTVDLSAVNVFANDLSQIDKAGMEILDLLRRVGYWICIILCSKDVIKHCMRGHLESIGSIIAMYGVAFGTLYFLPWLFDLIKNIF